MRGKRWIAAVVIGVTLGAGLPAVASARRQRLSAVVKGHRFRVRGNLVTSGHNTNSFSMVGGTKLQQLGQTLRAMDVTCAFGLGDGTFPAAGRFCTIGYTETRIAVAPTIKQWQSSTADTDLGSDVQVTFDSLNASVLKGTFQGTLAPYGANPDGPVTVKNGKFTAIFTN